MAQQGLLIDYQYCTGCHACEIACKIEHGYPSDQWGIKLAEIGPWQHADGKWEYNYLPMPTSLCDLCADRVAKGKLPTCVHHCQSLIMTFGDAAELGEKMVKGKMVLFTPQGEVEDKYAIEIDYTKNAKDYKSDTAGAEQGVAVDNDLATDIAREILSKAALEDDFYADGQATVVKLLPEGKQLGDAELEALTAKVGQFVVAWTRR